MALTSEQRIEISKKIVSVPTENASALDSKSKLEEVRVKTKSQDDGHKSFSDARTVLINGYQHELKRIDGNDRTEITEQDYLDSAVNKVGNFFFPNQQLVPTPSLTDGVWKQFVPYTRNKAVGKFYNESYPFTQNETTSISLIQGYNTTMDTYTGIQRSTGQSCTTVVPTPPPILPGVDTVANDPTLQTLANNIVSEAIVWKTVMTGALALIVTTDPDPVKQAQNNAAISDINNTISIINVWLATATFSTSHGQTTCAGFNSYNPFLLPPTKFRTDVFNPLKAEITARLAFLATRIPELTTNLGSITQNTTNGLITASSGLYGERFSFINFRLNLMLGTLKKLEGLKLGQKAQDEAVNFNGQVLLAYGSIIKVSTLSAPASGIDKIHLKDASGINIGDTIYIVANEQEEIQLQVVNKTGNLLQVNQDVSAKYRTDNLSRVYKIF